MAAFTLHFVHKGGFFEEACEPDPLCAGHLLIKKYECCSTMNKDHQVLVNDD